MVGRTVLSARSDDAPYARDGVGIFRHRVVPIARRRRWNISYQSRRPSAWPWCWGGALKYQTVVLALTTDPACTLALRAANVVAVVLVTSKDAVRELHLSLCVKDRVCEDDVTLNGELRAIVIRKDLAIAVRTSRQCGRWRCGRRASGRCLRRQARRRHSRSSGACYDGAASTRLRRRQPGRT